ncbi:histidine kinase [Longimycelium tulufanense]|uniref:histidine kinase n=1 Tax=Longimycelium tulufanense TaxID=907463 RepID=A0A8J3C7T4_9PSEU|nr:sensor histidine kinase [Longimycelium tulufanense]GGM50548.1 histidine kinase [Longimycelium tulufanense]
MARRRIRFARQLLLLQTGLVTVVVGLGFALFAWWLRTDLTDQYTERALTTARAVASNPDLGDAVLRDDPDQLVQARAESARLATDALFVVVTDDRGVRIAHPDLSRLGLPVSTDPSAPLAGREVANVQRGTLGLSARGKVPLHSSDGEIVGEVSVGFNANEIDRELAGLLGAAAVFALGATALGVAGAGLLSRLLKRRTLGLEPHELADLVREREAVLHGIGEGMLALDAVGRMSMCNREAARLLGIAPAPGVPVSELRLPARLHTALEHRHPVNNLLIVAGDRLLVAKLRPVRRDGRDLGCVLTLRDRTELEALTTELDSVRRLSEALRAQRHEFANRLHTLSGLLQTGRRHEAVEYLQALSAGPLARLGPGGAGVADPFLQAFLAAKTALAEERGVVLEVGETSWVPTRVVAPVEVITVVGNLVDNALDAAREGTRRTAAVEIDLLADGTTLHMSVVDSGEGVPETLRERIFDEGVSTKDLRERGLGLALARRAAAGLGGEVRLTDPGGAEHGAVFVARLPDALAPGALVAEKAGR